MENYKPIEGLSLADIKPLKESRANGFTFNLSIAYALDFSQVSVQFEIAPSSGIILPFPCKLVCMAVSGRLSGSASTADYVVNEGTYQVRVRGGAFGGNPLNTDQLREYADLNSIAPYIVEDSNTYVHRDADNNLDISRYGIAVRDFTLDVNASILNSADFGTLETYLTMRFEKV